MDGRTDLSATRLIVPQGAELDLSDAHGFVVLRAQTTLEIRGTLHRRLGAPAPDGLAKELRDCLKERRDWGALSTWIEKARSLNEPWTVIVAGGDLRVTGRVDVDGPLLLIAGGWIRVYGRVDAPKTQLFKSAPGGENIAYAHDAPLVLDAPDVNVLRTPLRVAIRTNPIRPIGGVERWELARPSIVDGGGGGYVRYLGLRDRPGGDGSDEFSPVDDVGVLDGCDALSLLLVLEMPVGDGEPWDPPRVEAVELVWRAAREPDPVLR